MAFRATSKVCKATIPSFGFSGAGFLTSYHLGAAKCLQENGFLNFDSKDGRHEPPMLTGVSGGALTVAAIVAGVNPEYAMNTTLAIAEKTREEGGILNSFKPGFSLLDHVEEHIRNDLLSSVDGDMELLLRRIQHGKLLRIGLTNRSVQPHVRNPNAYCFVDQYRDVEDIVAACVLSSYVPGFSGSLSGLSPTLQRASSKLREMADLGFIKKQSRPGGDISKLDPSPRLKNQRPPFLDGGLCNGFPVIDDQTVLVTPIRGTYEPNRWICPSNAEGKVGNLITMNQRVKLYIDGQTVKTFRQIVLSPNEKELQYQYSQGYDNAKQFLRNHNLEAVHKSCAGFENVNHVSLHKKETVASAAALLSAVRPGSMAGVARTSRLS